MVKERSIKDKVVCVVGLGYVGLPLAEAFYLLKILWNFEQTLKNEKCKSQNFLFSTHFAFNCSAITVIGYDINERKIDELNNKDDNIEFTNNASRIKWADFILISVPTPVTKSKEPKIKKIMNDNPILVDVRGMFDEEEVWERGFYYRSL